MASITISKATAEDVDVVLSFIKALAEYEKLSHAVVGSATELRRTLFGSRPFASALLARMDDKPVGFALYFFNYSTFLTKPGIYLEDLFVDPAARGLGVGKALLKRVAAEAVKMGAGRLEWAVLDWNDPAIGFYKSIGARPMDEWTVYRLDGDALSRFGGKPETTSFPDLTTKRLRLRPGTLSDAQRLTDLLQEPEIEANLASLPWPYTLHDAQVHLAGVGTREDEIDWLIEHPEVGVIGNIHLSVNRNHRAGYLGFWLGKAHWGQGYMPEAVKAVLNYGFDKLELQRIAAEHYGYNLASGRAMAKAGMLCEGTRRAAYRKAGRQVDAVVYALVRDDRRQ